MNFKTLEYLTRIPYTTLTNEKNIVDSISSADVALKITRALNKFLEKLLGNSVSFSEVNLSDKNILNIRLFKKYETLIPNSEKCNPTVQENFGRMVKSVVNRNDTLRVMNWEKTVYYYIQKCCVILT